MNIKITYNWLLEYLDTDADPYELQKYLSLCGPSVETVEKIGDDYVLDIEVTSNRVDMASVFGIAQEAQAILPEFGKKAKLRFNPLTKYSFENLKAEPTMNEKIHLEIVDNDLVSRFTALVFSEVNIKPSPDFISKRLQLCDIRSINTVVDISNYLMLSLGQPVHMFDYDKIVGNKMIVRRSKKGEKVTTLDNKVVVLPGDDIVIEDGSGTIMDLCGIMGGLSSAISNDTKNILFFVQTYNKQLIRKTSMKTGQRTLAATYFEKGTDPERVEPTFVYGVDLLNAYSGGLVDSKLIDVYPHLQKCKEIRVYLSDISKIIGVTLEEKKIITILTKLGFDVKRHEDAELGYPEGVSFIITVPTYRVDDMNIQEDVIEEIARVFGYHNIPNVISPPVYIKQPKDIKDIFEFQIMVKNYLKHIGFHEFLNYSMVSKELLKNLDFIPENHLKLSNTISTEIEYMRTSLIPSLIKNLKDNYGRREELKLFEIAKVYLPQQGDLPHEPYKFALAVNTDFSDIKGVIQGLFRELNVENGEFRIESNTLFSQISVTVSSGTKALGSMGQLKDIYRSNLGIKGNVFIAELDCAKIMEARSPVLRYKDPSKFSVVKLDLTIPKVRTFGEYEKLSYKHSALLQKLEFLGEYKGNISIRFYFGSLEKNITEEEAKQELITIQTNFS